MKTSKIINSPDKNFFLASLSTLICLAFIGCETFKETSFDSESRIFSHYIKNYSIEIPDGYEFIDKHDLPFHLIADTEKEVHDLYGTWIEKSMYGRKYMGTARTTFLIDEDGKIERIIEKVKTKDHVSQILD